MKKLVIGTATFVAIVGGAFSASAGQEPPITCVADGVSHEVSVREQQLVAEYLRQGGYCISSVTLP